jgi:hypothetical protein
MPLATQCRSSCAALQPDTSTHSTSFLLQLLAMNPNAAPAVNFNQVCRSTNTQAIRWLPARPAPAITARTAPGLHTVGLCCTRIRTASPLQQGKCSAAASRPQYLSLQDHLNGKQYLGWKKIRETFDELTEKYNRVKREAVEQPLERPSERDRYREHDRERERASAR